MKTNWNSALIALTVSAGLYSAGASAITGTTSVQATFKSTIGAGTCTAQIQDAGGNLSAPQGLAMYSNPKWQPRAAASRLKLPSPAVLG